jgi:chemotaxis protein methyltransferase CheR
MTALSALDIDFVRRLVHERSAIVIDQSKGYLIESRLVPLARQVGLGSVSELLDRLRNDHNAPLSDLVVDAMTTNETSFYRDLHLWDALRDQIIPGLVERRRPQRSLTFWSAACSSGQEPYSVAMMLVDRFPDVVANWNVRIIATDLSADMLGRAALGRFSQLEVNRGLPAPTLVKHFRRDGSYWQISDQIRQMVEFRALNLVRPWPFVPQVDVMFLRNVLIYFDLPTKQQVLDRALEVLRPDAHLLLGTAETTMNLDDLFQRAAHGRATSYQPQPS